MCDERCPIVRVSRTVRRVDSQVDGNVADALVLPRDAICLIFNLFTDHVEIGEHPTLTVQELGMFCNESTRNTNTLHVTSHFVV